MSTYPSAADPYAGLCYITATIGSTVWQGSGAIIGPHTILTASHVLWDNDLMAGATNVTVRIGSSTGLQITGAEAWHYNHVNDSGHALTRSDSQGDYAIIDVAADLSGYGVFGLTSGYSGGTVHMTGFPANAYGAPTHLVGTVSTDSHYGVLNFGTLSASPGSSGGPLWVTGGSGQAASIVGVVSTTGWADQLTAADIAQIHAWQAEDAFLWGHPAAPIIAHAGILTGDFDATYYLAHNPDVAASGMDPLQHYDKFGWHEGRNPNALFSTQDYLAENRDVAAAGANPLHHYEQWGWREGRNPSDEFSTHGYLSANQDVATAHIDPLHHFLQWGIDEGRQGWMA